MGDLTTLFSEVNIVSVILGVVLILICIKFIVELIEWIAKKFGFELKGKREKNEHITLLTTTAAKVDSMAEQINDIRTNQKSINDKIEKIEKDSKSYRQSDTRNEIIKQYNYYANSHTNPMLAWTSSEKDNFLNIYKTYDDNGGNSYVHDDIYPAMKKLKVIDLSDVNGLAELYLSRSKNTIN